MLFLNRLNLIPRNNWDYGVFTLLFALASCFRGKTRASSLEALFTNEPIWTVSGRASLFAILKALSLPPESKVGVPLFCCSVVFQAIRQARLKPVFIDSNLHDFNLSSSDFASKREVLSALVAVHMFGHPCDMDEIKKIAGKIPVIEDCAQSLHSAYKGRLTGTLSNASFFSFRCGKYISAGEGSAIFCQDGSLRKEVEKVVSGFDKPSLSSSMMHCIITYIKAAFYQRPFYGTLGYPIGMRLDKKLNLTAKGGFDTGRIWPGDFAVVEARASVFKKKINRQVRHAQLLKKHIVLKNAVLPNEGQDFSLNWFQFPLRFEGQSERDAMAAHLWRSGIDSAKYLDSIVDEAKEAYGYRPGQCPIAEKLSKTVLLVPIHYTLKEKDIIRIAESINSFA